MIAGSRDGFDPECFGLLVNTDNYLEALEYAWDTGYGQSLRPGAGYAWAEGGHRDGVPGLKLPLYNFALLQVRMRAEAPRDQEAAGCLERCVSKDYLEWHRRMIPLGGNEPDKRGGKKKDPADMQKPK